MRSLDCICQELFLSPEARERDNNLAFVRERILRSGMDIAALLSLYGRVHSGQHVQYKKGDPLASDGTFALRHYQG
jgi:hypothetical protein